MRYLRLAPLFLALALLLLSAGKILWLPIAIIGPSVSAPAFVGVASYLLERDPALYCVDDLRTSCSTERVGRHYYSVIATLPFWLWATISLLLPLLIGVSVFLATSSFRTLLSLLAAIVAVNLVATSSLYIDQGAPDARISPVELGRVSVDLREGIATISLEVSEYVIESATCRAQGIELETSVEGNVVKVKIPSNVVESLYATKAAEKPRLFAVPASVEQSVSISCDIDLDKGKLRGSYSLSFKWEEPIIIAKNGTPAIINRLPLSLSVLLEIVGQGVFSRSEITLAPFEEREVSLAGLPRGEYRVGIIYRFLGSERGQSIDVQNR